MPKIIPLLSLAVIGSLAIGYGLAGWGSSHAANSQDEVTQLRSENASLKKQITALDRGNQTLAEKSEECSVMERRTTVLYDGPLIQRERWIIPVDVTPKIVGDPGNAAFTHFDPATQTETVKMAPVQAK